MPTELLFNSLTDPSTTLAGNGGSITAGATSFNVAGVGGTSAGSGQFRIIVGTEIMIVGAGAGTTAWSSVTRGAEGTTAATHNDGDNVYVVLTAGTFSNLAYTANPHSSAGHTGSVLPVANQTLQGNLDDSAGDTHSIGGTNRFLLINGKTLRTEYVGASTPTGGADGDIKVGNGKIWVKAGGVWTQLLSTTVLAAAAYDYVVVADDVQASAINLVRNTLDFTGTPEVVCNQVNSVLSGTTVGSVTPLRTVPGGVVRYFSTRTDGTFPVGLTLHTTPGMTMWFPGDGKRGSTNGRNAGIVVQATAGFAGSPMLSYLNQVHQQGPTAAPTGAVSVGGSMTVGDHYYGYTWSDGTHESPLSPPSAVQTTTSANKTVTLTLPTKPSWATTANVYRTWTIPPAPTAGAPTAGGAVDNGAHKWAVTWTNNATESLLGNLSVSQTCGSSNNTVALTNVPLGAANTTKRTIYRTKAGGSTYFKVADINDNVTTTFSDTTADSGLGAQVWAAFQYARNDLMWSIGTTATTSFVDTTSDNAAAFLWAGTPYYNNQKVVIDARGMDESLLPVGGAAGNVNGTVKYVMTFTIGGVESEGAPISSVTVANQQVTVQLPIGPAGTTARTLYRTANGGSVYKLQSTTANNTTTSVVDNTADAGLGATLAATIPTVLPQPRENLTINGLGLDCNGNGAGSQGADIGVMIKGAGGGNQARMFECDIFNFNQHAYRVCYSGEEVGSTDVQMVDCAGSTNSGTSYNVSAILGMYGGDFALTCQNNFASMAGNGTCAGVHIRAGSANVRITGPGHVGGGGGGVSDIVVDSCNGLWIEGMYLDNVTFPVGAIWLRPFSNTSIGRLVIKDNIINHNADVPFITFDGGKSSAASGFTGSFIRIFGNTSPGSATQNNAALKFVNGWQNARGLDFSMNHFAAYKKSTLIDSSGNNGNTITLDRQEGNMFDTVGSTPVNMLGEQYGTATFAAATTVVVTHNLRKAPDYVLVTPVTNITLWVTTITSTQFTINASASQSTTVFWHAKAVN